MLEVLLTSVWLLAAFFALSNASIDFLVFFGLFFGALLLVGLWGMRAVFLLARLVLRDRSYGAAARWLALPVAFLLAVVAFKTDALFRLRLRMSQNALYAYAQSLPEGADERYPDPGRRIGLFWVTEAENIQGCVRMITVHGFLDDYGVAYCPKGTQPLVEGEDFYRHLFGPWWRWHRSW